MVKSSPEMGLVDCHFKKLGIYKGKKNENLKFINVYVLGGLLFI